MEEAKRNLKYLFLKYTLKKTASKQYAEDNDETKQKYSQECLDKVISEEHTENDGSIEDFVKDIKKCSLKKIPEESSSEGSSCETFYLQNENGKYNDLNTENDRCDGSSSKSCIVF